MPSIINKQKELSLPQIITLLIISVLIMLFDSIGLFNIAKDRGALINNYIVQNSPVNLSKFSQLGNIFNSKEDLIEQIASLESKVEDLNSKNIELEKKLGEFKILDEQAKFQLEGDLIPAQIIGTRSDRYGYFIVNKGRNKNIQEGSAVVFNNYILGEIVEVYGKTALGRFILSPDLIIQATSLNSNTQGVVKGVVGSGLIMEDIARGGLIEIGDIIITSGQNSKFQRGFIIGEVESIDSGANLATKSAKIKSLYDIQKAVEIFILEPVSEND